MGSKKRAAWAKQKARFDAQLGGTGKGLADSFERENRRRAQAAEQRKESLRERACESKNRYAHLEDAEEALDWCESRGKRGLSIYECPYCGGWHLTSRSFS